MQLLLPPQSRFLLGGIDMDGSLSGLQFYVDGKAYGSELKLPSGVSDENYIFSTFVESYG